MKKVLCLAFACTTLFAYSQSGIKGIYLTGEDYSKNNLSFAAAKGAEKHKIRLNDFFAKSYITVLHRDTAYTFFKSEIFGYQTYGGQTIRFLHKKELVLLNAGEPLLIYKHVVSKPPIGRTNVTNYYFSKDALSPALLLTFTNLKKVFPTADKFHEKLASLFRYNTDLASYDEAHKQYRLSEIFQTTTLNQRP